MIMVISAQIISISNNSFSLSKLPMSHKISKEYLEVMEFEILDFVKICVEIDMNTFHETL